MLLFWTLGRGSDCFRRQFDFTPVFIQEPLRVFPSVPSIHEAEILWLHFTENKLASCGWGRKEKSSSCIEGVGIGSYCCIRRVLPPAPQFYPHASHPTFVVAGAPSPEPPGLSQGGPVQFASSLHCPLRKVLHSTFSSFSPPGRYLVLHRCFLVFLKAYLLFL